MRFKNGLVLMTGLPFHKGHEFLINFASGYVEGGEVLVILSSRQHEPICGSVRVKSIEETFNGSNVVVYHHSDDNAPQNPVGDFDVKFWEYWKDVIRVGSKFLKHPDIEYVFSSENYGKVVADVIGAEHVMVDNKRQSILVSGTKIRNNPIENYNMINDFMVKNIRKKFVFFGAESVGKSTMTSVMGKYFTDSITAPEYARPFLESQEDKSPSVYNMHMIFKGQNALENAITKSIGGNVVAFLDTDIMSTFGYAEMVGMQTENYLKYLPDDERVYIILAQDEVPFEPDVLRYGDGKRESSDQFWVDILRKYGKKCHVVNGNMEERVEKVKNIVLKEVETMFKFERE